MSRLQDPTTFSPTITPAGQAVDAGPWRLTLAETRLADEAYAIIADTNAGNDPAPAGLAWVLARFTAENISDQARVINLTDFAATGTDGVLRRPPAMVCPDPALQASVDPGAAVDGWVPLQVNTADTVVAWFSSPFLDATSEAWFAVTDGATLPGYDPAPAGSDLGSTPESAAAFNQTVRAGDFDVAVLDHISGQAVYDIATTGLRALAGSTGTATWHALRVRVTNTSPRPAFFSFTALQVADVQGDAWDHVLALTPPIPDAARELLPGATREGWAAFDEQPWSTLQLIRVQPSAVADEPRFITFGGAPAAPSPGSGTPAPDFAPGDVVVLTENRVNLREDASASAPIIVEMERGTELTITGERVAADSYTWYPVEASGSGEAGYVVADFLAPAEN